MIIWQAIRKQFHNLRMRDQIFLVKICAFLISFILILSFYIVQKNVIIGIYENSSTIVLQRQDKKALNLLLPQLNYYLISKQYHRIQLLTSLGSLYSLLDHFHISEQSKDSLKCETEKEKDFLFSIPQLCLTCYLCKDGNQLPQMQKYQDLQKFSRLLSEYILLFDTTQHNRIFYVATGDIQVGFIYPQVIYDWSFSPQSKNWFVNHLDKYQQEKDQKYFFSKLYFSGTQFIYKQTISYSLENQYTKALDAIAGTDFDAEDPDMQLIQANTYLLNQDGQIIYRKVNLNLPVTELNFIYEENKTGFNQTDWNEIFNFANKNPSISNCQLDEKQILCRYNSIYKKPIKIVANQIPGNFTLMMFTNASFEHVLQENFLELELLVQQANERAFYIQIIISCSLIFISMIIVIFIFRPILRVMTTAKIYIKKMGNNLDKEIFKLMNKKKKGNSVFNNLELQIINFSDILTKNQQQKGIICRQIEKYQYSKQMDQSTKIELLCECTKIQLTNQISIPTKHLQQMISQLIKQFNQYNHLSKTVELSK
ncbi:unnamed protein product (macronuclear) [Paramecium tetraurelia]|uniref:Transmembrane protein n=1 Tax=Paramecium tetraurelia TaxID=5888 RepID=A0C998_PARTE|nr:uncharacterized protein GSPATT00006671001 [Paramecium tetraurelia]CAK67365.1 unnamed protein product [Paramecium tetraurelia]|eukprot:XP_001434762.1 hypothetical protein (macronuclear) [Paramecium tetraurelia strain d4-2]